MTIKLLTYARKILFWTLTFLASLLLISLLLLQTSFFQNYLTDFVLEKINAQTRQTAKITNIKIKWFDFVEIKGLEVKDYKGNRLVYASSLDVDYQLNHLISEGNLLFDKVVLETGELNLIKYQDTLAINLVEFINDLNNLNRKPREPKKKATQLSFGNVRLSDFYFSYNNFEKDSLEDGYFDYGHFRLDIPAASILNFKLRNDTIEASIRSFEGMDRASGLDINKLKSDFHLCNRNLTLKNLLLETPNSTVRDFVKLEYASLKSLGYFVDSVTFDVNLVGSTISKKDLDLFANIPVDDFELDITSRISGSIPRLSFDGLKISTGQRSHLYGDIDFTGLPDIEETFVDARIDDAELLSADLHPFLGDVAANLATLGSIGFTGRFLGFTNDFVANAEFQTDKGNVSSDLNLKFPKSWRDASYSGSLKLDGFNVGSLINKPSMIGVVNLDGKIDGKGLTQQKARFFLNARLDRSTFFGYTYEKIEAKGDFAAELFKGELLVEDKNCDLTVYGDVDLGASPEVVNIRSRIDTLNLMELGFTDEPFQIASTLDANVTSLNIDSVEGEIKLKDIMLSFRGESINLDSLHIRSFRNAANRTIDLSLADLRANLEGNFLFSTLLWDARKVVREVKDYFSTGPGDSQPPEVFEEDFDQYTIDFTLEYGDINEYVKLIKEDLYLSDNGRIEGTYYQRRNATLSFYTKIDSINYQGIGYKGNSLDVNLSKDLDSMGIIASAYLISEKQIWRNIKTTEDLEVEGVWFNNKINLNLNIDQPGNNSSASISAEMRLLEDRLVFNFLPSRVIAMGNRWFFNPYNQINLIGESIIFDRLELYQNEQSILLKGRYSDSLTTDLALEFTDFDLSILNTVFPTKVGGILNSKVDLSRDDFRDPFKLTSQININDLEANEFIIGNLEGSTNWDPMKKGLNIDLDITRQSVNTVAVSGYYYPDSVDQLDIKSEFNGAALGLLDPFFVGLFSNLRGGADGNIQVSGKLSRPILNGKMSVSDGRMTFDYLGTTYDFSGDLSFDNRAINFDGIRLVDRDGDRASLSGKISHSGFQDFNTDIHIAASNFSFLNTTAIDNSLYYGTANASGDITITGPFNDLLIDANATTEKGTKIYIPLSSESDVTQKDYISFVDFSDTTKRVNLEEIVRQSISGVRLDFEIDVTTDAYVELIFNFRTGDIIRGRGNGNLNMRLDTNGEFELFGDISITEGAYNFTIPNFINKEFVVVPGSTISWYGDPYSGVLNLEATYRQLASFEDYRGLETEGVSQKYPVLVVLKLQGDMLSPTIDFEVRMDNTQASPATDQQLILQTINNDEQELKRQVFSLLILRKFSPQQSFSVGAGASSVSSVSEFLSNQFSYFVSQMDENLEVDVDVDLESLDPNAFNTFQLRLSYTFLDGRLRVSGGGAISQNAAEDASATDFVGDWSVRYLLTSDGHLRVKAFSQAEQIAGAQQRETGVSFQYIKSFDDFRELLRKSREEAIKTKPKDMSEEKRANNPPGT